MAVTTYGKTIADPVIRRDITVRSTLGAPIFADVYEPASRIASGWATVVCPGYGSVKELMTGWGNALAAQGHRVLVIGYRGYGDPNVGAGRIFPKEHVEDVRAGVRWLRADQGSDRERIAIMGVSYGGAIAIEAAALESDVDAAISIVGYGSGSRHLRSLRTSTQWDELADLVHRDRMARSLTGQSMRISLDEILQRDAEGQRWREKVEAQYPGMKFDVTVESVDQLLEFEPEGRLPFPRPLPFLVIHAEKDAVIPLDEAHAISERADGPTRLVVIDGAEHHDVHSGPAFRRCLDEIGAFLEEGGI